MLTTIIAIGNSRGICIPKILLDESGLDNTVILSEKALGVDWNRPEEDKAWNSLQ